jgi:hypothetical protein
MYDSPLKVAAFIPVKGEDRLDTMSFRYCSPP